MGFFVAVLGAIIYVATVFALSPEIDEFNAPRQTIAVSIGGLAVFSLLGIVMS